MADTYQQESLGGIIHGLTRQSDKVSFLIPRNGEPEVNYLLNPDYLRYKTDVAAGTATILSPNPPKIKSFDIYLEPKVGRTTTAAALELARFTIPTRSRFRAELEVNGISSTGADSYFRRVLLIIQRIDDVPTIIGSVQTVAPITHGTGNTWSSNGSIAGNDFVITVGGQAGKTIDWELRVKAVQFSPEGK